MTRVGVRFDETSVANMKDAAPKHMKTQIKPQYDGFRLGGSRSIHAQHAPQLHESKHHTFPCVTLNFHTVLTKLLSPFHRLSAAFTQVLSSGSHKSKLMDILKKADIDCWVENRVHCLQM